MIVNFSRFDFEVGIHVLSLIMLNENNSDDADTVTLSANIPPIEEDLEEPSPKTSSQIECQTDDKLLDLE